MNGYLTTKQFAEKWGITDRQVQILCKTSRIDRAERIGGIWLIPENVIKPTRFKAKSKKSQKENKDTV